MKSSRLGQIIQQGQADMLFIQENKIHEMNEELAISLSESMDIEWSAKSFEGASGGMIMIWRQ